MSGTRLFVLAAAERPATMSPAVEDVTGYPARTFSQWANDYATDFR